MFRISVLLLAAAVLPAAPILVNASVDDLGLIQIGTINLTTDGPTFRAKFEFGNPKLPKLGKRLDGWYDFHWLQIVDKIFDDGKAVTEIPGVLGKLPAIDPQPGDKGATDKKKGSRPYYYNSDEWESGKFGEETIREEGVFSLLSDTPMGQPNKREIRFLSYLVAEDLTVGKFSGKKFSVLAGFDWKFFGKGELVKGVAEAGKSFAIDDMTLKHINESMARASVGGDFKGWEALRGQTLYQCVPEPATATLGLIGVALIVVLRRRPTIH